LNLNRSVRHDECFVERKAMIDPAHDLSITNQAEALNISRPARGAAQTAAEVAGMGSASVPIASVMALMSAAGAAMAPADALHQPGERIAKEIKDLSDLFPSESTAPSLSLRCSPVRQEG
jgi:hypothetical protein